MHTTQELVEQFMPFAKKLAYKKKRMVPRFIDVEELLSAAYLGLVEAASRFNEEKGVQFQTFAYPRIWGAINDHLRGFGACAFGDEEQDLGEMIEAKKEADNFDEVLEFVAKDLDENAAGMLKLYFEEDLPMKEVGSKFGVSESRISQIFSSYKKSIREKWTFEELVEELAA